MVDINENSHLGTEFRVSAGGNFEGGVMKSRQRYWRAGQSLPEQKPGETETGRGLIGWRTLFRIVQAMGQRYKQVEVTYE